MGLQATKPKPGTSVPEPTPDPPKTFTITSFGFDFGLPAEIERHVKDYPPHPFTHDHGGVWVFDARRAVRNPWAVSSLRKLSGQHPDVQAFVEDCPAAMKVFGTLYGSICAYLQFSHLQIWIGCRRGKHRSVAIAELLGKQLQQNYPHANYTFNIVHRDIDSVLPKPTPAATPCPA